MENDVTSRVRIGQVLLTPTGHGVGTFDAVLDPDVVSQVAVGDTVVAQGADGTAVGVITDMKVVGPYGSALAVANTSEVEELSIVTETREATIATVQVFHAPALRPVRAGVLYHGILQDLNDLCGLAKLETPIPVGVVQLASGLAPVYVDGEELLGPLAAHLVCGGRSGAAAKTSYISVLLATAMQTMRKRDKKMAAILFNVKGPDLLTLDKPAPEGELTQQDLAAYAALDVNPEPFEDVTVYAPALPGGNGVQSFRDDAVGVQWGLLDTWKYLQYLDKRLVDTDNAWALTNDLAARKVYGHKNPAKSLAELCGWLKSQIEEAEEAGRSEVFGNHHIATARKVLRSLEGLKDNTKGLVAWQRPRAGSLDIPDTFRAGQVVVVDVAALEPRIQAAVIARTCSRILDTAAESRLGVDNLVIFADELNVFAPVQTGEVPKTVKDILGKVAATGRYAGISLWGAAQFPSGIHGQIRDNASVHVLGAVADTELDSGVYGRLPNGVREQMVTASRGHMMLRAANLRSWTPIMFPRPAWAAGNSKSDVLKKQLPKMTDAVNLSETSWRNLSEGVDEQTRDAIIVAAAGDEAEVVKKLEEVREPDMRRIAPEPASVWKPDNVWDIDE